jgi:hypothetical protein
MKLVEVDEPLRTLTEPAPLDPPDLVGREVRADRDVFGDCQV